MLSIETDRQRHRARLAEVDENSDEYHLLLAEQLRSTSSLKKAALERLSAISDASACIRTQPDHELSCWTRLSWLLSEQLAFGAINRLLQTGSITIDDPQARRLVADPSVSELLPRLGQEILTEVLMPNLAARNL